MKLWVEAPDVTDMLLNVVALTFLIDVDVSHTRVSSSMAYSMLIDFPGGVGRFIRTTVPKR